MTLSRTLISGLLAFSIPITAVALVERSAIASVAEPDPVSNDRLPREVRPIEASLPIGDEPPPPDDTSPLPPRDVEHAQPSWAELDFAALDLDDSDTLSASELLVDSDWFPAATSLPDPDQQALDLGGYLEFVAAYITLTLPTDVTDDPWVALYTKEGRSWTVKESSTPGKGEKQKPTYYTRYTVKKVNPLSVEIEVQTVDKDGKPVGAPSTQTTDFQDIIKFHKIPGRETGEATTVKVDGKDVPTLMKEYGPKGEIKSTFKVWHHRDYMDLIIRSTTTWPDGKSVTIEVIKLVEP